MPLTCIIEKLPGGTAVVTLSGPMTLGTSLKLVDSQVQLTIANGYNKLVVDLTSVDYVDSSGLGMLVFTYGTLNQLGGAFRLCGVAARVLMMLKITKTDTLLAIDPTREESLAALAKL
jgi:anti-anti-sigma factor